MEMRSFGRTGVKVSAQCLGTMNFGNKTEAEEAIRMVDYALDNGINFIDTANVYGRGNAEEVVGKALTKNGQRDRTILATKAHFSMSDDDPNMQGNSRRHLIAACEASLKRLRTDYIDVFQLHRPDPSVPIDESLRALDDLIRAGKVRYIGTSCFAAWQIVEAITMSKELGINRFVSEQAPYHLLERRVERELVGMIQKYELALMAWSPLAGGFLTGKYKDINDRPEDARYNVQGQQWADRFFSNASFKLIEILQKMADAKFASVSQLALAWVMQQPAVTAAIIGPRNMEQLEDNLKAFEVKLTATDLDIIDKVVPPGRFFADCYSLKTQ